MDRSLSRKFMEEIGRIKNPEIFLGVSRILKVKLFEEKVEDSEDGGGGKKSKEPRDFVDMFADVMSAYDARDRKFKRELYKILRKANEAQELIINADNPENTKEAISDEKMQ